MNDHPFGLVCPLASATTTSDTVLPSAMKPAARAGNPARSQAATVSFRGSGVDSSAY